MEGYIDTEDLPMLIELNYHWSLMWNVHSQNWYARTLEYYVDEQGTRKARLHSLHREIMQVFDKLMVVDHREHKNQGTLNNRKSNLRVASDKQNSKNRKSRNSNNKSGHRNVSWNGSGWSVQIQIEGKNTTLKRFKRNQLDEAGEYAKKMREQYYGEFAGKN